MSTDGTPRPIDPAEELSVLVRTLHETQRRIAELTGGAVDAVMHPSGISYLLTSAQTHLRDSEALQRHYAAERAAILDALPAHIALLDSDARIVAVNRAWRRFADVNLFLGGEAALGQNYIEICENARGEDAEEAPMVAAGIRSVLEGAAADFAIEYPCHAPDEKRWFRLIVTPLDERRRVGAVVMQVNITERKLAETRLERAADLLRIAGRMARIGGWSVDLETRTLQLSDEVAAIHELPSGTLLTLEDAIGFYPTWSRERLAERFKSCAKQGTPYDEELEFVTANGTPLWVRTMGEAIRDEKGRIIRLQGAIQDISQRREMETALLLNERRFREFADALTQLIWTADADGRVDFANRAYFEFVGKENVDLPAGERSTFVHPDDIEAVERVWADCVMTGQPYTTEFRIRGRDDAYRWHLVTATPIRNEAGAVVKWYGTGIDVHDRKLAEAQLRESDARFRAIARATADVVWDWNLKEGELWWSDTIQKLSGYSDDEIGHTIEAWSHRILPEDRARVHRSMETAIAQRREFWQDEYRLLHKDGSIVEIQDRGFLILDRDGNPSRFVGGMSDISERKRIQAKIAEQAALLDAAQDAIIVRDLDLRIRYWNRGAERMYGWTADEVIGQTAEDLFYENPEEFRQGARAAQETGQWTGLLRLHRKDGAVLSVQSNLSLVRDADGNPVSIFAIKTDVTKQINLEEQLRQSLRLEAIGQLTGGIAHDFNNLLTVILGNAEILVDDLGEAPSSKSLANMIMRSAERGAELTNRLLAFARRQALDPIATDVYQVITAMDDLLRRSLGGDIEITTVNRDGTWQALVDPSQLESALLNLCLNARDAMPDGGKLTIETASIHLDQDYADRHGDVSPGDYVMIAVSDTGTGMSPEVLARAFDPFFTTKPTGKGSGMGLSMVYGFVKQSNGHVKIYTELGHGTTVRLYLPRADAVAGSVSAPMPAGEVTGGTEKILVVEDDELVRAHAASLLGSFGYEVLTAKDGREALDLLRNTQEFDMLFTDVVMPGGMNGRQLAEAARELRPDLPVLFTSGYTEDALVHQGRLDHGIQLLTKPYRREDLAAKVRMVLDRPPENRQ